MHAHKGEPALQRHCLGRRLEKLEFMQLRRRYLSDLDPTVPVPETVKPLPPLDCLRFFEAAARHRSFALAGKELGVTSARRRPPHPYAGEPSRRRALRAKAPRRPSQPPRLSLSQGGAAHPGRGVRRVRAPARGPRRVRIVSVEAVARAAGVPGMGPARGERRAAAARRPRLPESPLTRGAAPLISVFTLRRSPRWDRVTPDPRCAISVFTRCSGSVRVGQVPQPALRYAPISIGPGAGSGADFAVRVERSFAIDRQARVLPPTALRPDHAERVVLTVEANA